MELALGQVYERRDQPGKRVRVVELRPAMSPKGMEVDSALAIPAEDTVASAHPFDVTILSPYLPHHGDQVWRLVEPGD